MVNFVLDKIKLKFLRRKWRFQNTHNQTYIIGMCNINIINVGKGTYGPIEVVSWGAYNEALSVGSYCSISLGVKFILGGNHQYNTIMSYPFKVMIFNTHKIEAFSKGEIIIEDDVWIGTDAMVLSGVKIGKGSVIGAGCVVAKDVLPYSIVVGNPARVIKRRFSDEVINYLLKEDFSLIDFENIPIENLYKQVQTVEDASQILYGE